MLLLCHCGLKFQKRTYVYSIAFSSLLQSLFHSWEKFMQLHNWTSRRSFKHSAFHWPWFYLFFAPFLLGVASGAVRFSAVSLVVSVFPSAWSGQIRRRAGSVPFRRLVLFYGFVLGCFFCLPELCRPLIVSVFAPLFLPFSHLCQTLCHCSFRMVWTVRL